MYHCKWGNPHLISVIHLFFCVVNLGIDLRWFWTTFNLQTISQPCLLQIGFEFHNIKENYPPTFSPNMAKKLITSPLKGNMTVYIGEWLYIYGSHL